MLVELKRHGLIHHLGLSNVTPAQLAETQTITEIVCVQNFYNVARRPDDGFIDDLAAQGIAYMPFFPLGGFTAAAAGSRFSRCCIASLFVLTPSVEWLRLMTSTASSVLLRTAVLSRFTTKQGGEARRL